MNDLDRGYDDQFGESGLGYGESPLDLQLVPSALSPRPTLFSVVPDIDTTARCGHCLQLRRDCLSCEDCGKATCGLCSSSCGRFCIGCAAKRTKNLNLVNGELP